jgi:hypothetical protein
MRADETNGTHYQNKDDGQHDGVFSNVLPVVGKPQLSKAMTHVAPLLTASHLQAKWQS